METHAPVKLTSLSSGSGCGCKIPPGDLRDILKEIPTPSDPALLVGTDTIDDAGVYQVRDDLALVQTVDFFTPIVDDPYDFGRAAAANAVSDIYAMGAVPLTALNLVSFSLDQLGEETLRQILRGGADIAAQAEMLVVGGHSIADSEPKYGLAVTGAVHPKRIVRNSTGRAGDALYLTKPIGIGVIATAIKRGNAPEPVVAQATEVMTTLNRDAAEAALCVGPSAATDITGYGLLGHLHELALASGVAAEVWAGAVPVVDGVAELAGDKSHISGGTRRNREFIRQWTDFEPRVDETRQLILCDAMTSGGLLIAIPEEQAEPLHRALVEAGTPAAARIGQLGHGKAGHIKVRSE